MNRNIYVYAAACALILLCVELAFAQSLDTPQTRMRPIGSGSAVDQYRSPASSTFQNNFSVTANRNPSQQTEANVFRQVSSSGERNSFVRQAVMMQQSGIVPPNLNDGNFSLPPDVVSGGSSGPVSSNPNTFGNPPLANSVPGTRPVPQINSLPSNPPTFNPPPASSSVLTPGPASLGGSDYLPLAQPQLQNSFATIDNCNCISGPSTYSAASGIGCGIAPCGYVPQSYAAPQTYAAPPAQIAPQVIMPPSSTVGSLAAPSTANAAPIPSLVTLGQQTFPVEVGQGLWGQPVAYVPGQGFRNWVRYFFP